MKSLVKVGVVPAVQVLALAEMRKILLLVGQVYKDAEGMDVVVQK